MLTAQVNLSVLLQRKKHSSERKCVKRITPICIIPKISSKQRGGQRKEK